MEVPEVITVVSWGLSILWIDYSASRAEKEQVDLQSSLSIRLAFQIAQHGCPNVSDLSAFNIQLGPPFWPFLKGGSYI